MLAGGIWTGDFLLSCRNPVDAGKGYRLFNHFYPLSFPLLLVFATGAPVGAWAIFFFIPVLFLLATAPLLERTRLPTSLLGLAYLAGGAAFLLGPSVGFEIAPDLSGKTFSACEGILLFANACAGGILLGAVVQAMILGHWYFVRPSMDRAPFLAALRRTIGLVAARGGLAFMGGALTIPWRAWGGSEAWLAGGFGDPLVALVRVLLGFLGLPLILHGARECARIGAVQPATGMLYAAIFFVGFAEVSALLLLKHGIAL